MSRGGSAGSIPGLGLTSMLRSRDSALERLVTGGPSERQWRDGDPPQGQPLISLLSEVDSDLGKSLWDMSSANVPLPPSLSSLQTRPAGRKPRE